MKKCFFTLLLAVIAVVSAYAIPADSISYNNVAIDSTNIAQILDKTRGAQLATSADRVVYVARQLVGSPYQAGTLEGDTELLVVNTSQFDCTTFVETVLALAVTAANDTAQWGDFAHNLLGIRYRGGVIDGYSSRLHYMSDWVKNNTQQGLFTEVTSLCPKAAQMRIDLNYMTAHRRSYPALSVSDAEYEKMQNIEAEYYGYSYHYIPKNQLAIQPVKKFFKAGDIVLITTDTKGLDVSHMGIVVVKNGEPYLLHASSKSRSVIVDNQSLNLYINNLKGATGVRVLRLVEQNDKE